MQRVIDCNRKKTPDPPDRWGNDPAGRERQGPPVPEPVPPWDLDWDAADDDERDRWIAYHLFGRREPFEWYSAGYWVYDDGRVADEPHSSAYGMRPEDKTYDHVRSSCRRCNEDGGFGFRTIYRPTSYCPSYTTSLKYDYEVLDSVRTRVYPWPHADFPDVFADNLEQLWGMTHWGEANPIAYQPGDYSKAAFITLRQLGPCPNSNIPPKSTPTEPSSAA